MDLTPGRVVGRYQLNELIGSGGMGEVYLAYDPQLDRRVAIKLLPPHLSADASARQRLHREALAAAALDHPFICKVFEVADQDDAVFLVMEYVRGETLQMRLAAGRPHFAEALRIAGEIAEAVEEAHENGLIHRDLKPSNIMLTGHGRVKVMDFGLAKRLPGGPLGGTVTLGKALVTTAGTVVGTIEYMSPEQLTGGTLDARSDLFSFGIVLCELLVGKHPFRRRSAVETIAAILRDPPDLAAGEAPALAPGWLVLIRRLLAKSPEDRYPSMRNVRSDMTRLATQGSIESDAEPKPAANLIGREAERAELVSLLDAALAGRGSVVLIGGEPGIGKTHLTRAIIAEAAARGCFTLVGHCSEMEGAAPYVPFIEMLEYCARVVPRESFRTSLGDAAPEVAKLMPELRQMYLDIPPAVELPPEQQRRYLFNAYREFVGRAARVTPLVAVFEDLHWADEPSLHLLAHLAQTVSVSPILMIGTYRDVELDPRRPFAAVLQNLVREKLASRISLRRLGVLEVQLMLTRLSGQSPPLSLVNIIFNETEGNPFFVEEVYRYLAERGILFDEEGNWRPAFPPDELQVPQGVRMVIGRRLERLTEDARRVLTTAAVIGRSFSFSLLEDLNDANADTVLEAVEAAESAHLVMPQRVGREMRYRFVHELVRQTLIEGLSLPRRQRLHARIADSIERFHKSNLDSQASALAHHLYHAGGLADTDKTVHYLMLAARFASTGAANEEALTSIENALSIVQPENHPLKPELHAARAFALRSLCRFNEAAEAFERAIAGFIEAGNTERAAEASFQLGVIYLWRLDFSGLSVVIERALQVIGTQPSRSQHRFLMFKSFSMAFKGDLESALDALARAKQIQADLPEIVDDGFASMCETRVLYANAQMGKAYEMGSKALAHFRGTGNLWEEVEIFEPILAALWLGRPSEARLLLRESEGRAERVGNQNAIWVHKTVAIDLLLTAGELEAADRAARDTHDFALQVSPVWVHFDRMFLGEIAHYRGRFDEALRYIRMGMQDAPPGFFSGLLSGLLFWTLAAQADPEATSALALAIPDLPTAGRPLSVGSCGCLTFVLEGLAILGRMEECAALETQAERLVASGPFRVHGQHLFRTSAGIAAAAAKNWARAEEHHRTAVHQADSAPYRPAQAIARSWYAEMLIGRGLPGDKQRARELMGEALARYRALKMPWRAQQTASRMAAIL